MDRDEWPRIPPAVLMNGVGDQLLAGARFTVNQHGHIGRRRQLNQFEDATHLRRLAQHFVELKMVFEPPPQLADFPITFGILQRRTRRFEHRRPVKGLHDKVTGAQLEHVHCRLNIRVRCHRDHRQFGIFPMDM